MDPSQRNPNVRRQLFPSEPNDEDYNKKVEETLQNRLEEQKVKWNFDFNEDCMLSNNGTYIWTVGDGGRYDWIGRPNEQEAENAKDNGDETPSPHLEPDVLNSKPKKENENDQIESPNALQSTD